jgi:hypothetical protein
VTKAAYHAWFPAVRRGELSVLLTRGERAARPVGSREFYAAVLAATGVEAQIAAWGVESLLTSYFTGDFEEAWEARLLVDGTPTLPDEPAAGVAVPADSGVAEPPELLPVVVLADFEQKKAALGCRDALREESARARAEEVHYERYAVRQVARRHVQLLVQVLTVPAADPARGVDAAARVIEVSREHGGRIQVR